MTKLDQAFEAISALPPARQDEAAEAILQLAAALSAKDDVAGESALAPQQWAEVRRRLARGFQPADPARLE